MKQRKMVHIVWRQLSFSSLAIVAFLSGGITTSLAAAIDERPNVLIILVDDLRYDALSVNQNTDYSFFLSPNINRIANEGIRFDNSFVVQSLCSPSRATVLTGLYPHNHGVVSIHYGLYQQGKDYIPADMSTIPKIMHKNGYETAWIGKWHLGNAHNRREFDRWVSFEGQGDYMNPVLFEDNQRIRHPGQHITPLLVEHMVDFINQERSKPFFAVLSHKAVHAYPTPPEHLEGIFDNETITPPATWLEDLSDKPQFYQDCMSERPPPETYNEQRVRDYFATLMGIEEGVGELLSALEARGILDDTLVIFTSDNGLFLGEHDMWDKRFAWEESMRIPLFVRYPKWFTAGTVSEQYALNLDFPTTVLDAAGIDNVYGMEGVSLRALAAGEESRESMLFQWFSDGKVCLPPLRAVRNNNWKYTQYFEEHSDDLPPIAEELYDLVADPTEDNNLIGNPAYDEIVETMKNELSLLRNQYGDDTDDFLDPRLP